MKNKVLVLAFVVLFLTGINTLGWAQGKLRLGLDNYAKDAEGKQIEDRTTVIKNLDDNISPILDLFGFYTGGGLFHTAEMHNSGGFDVGLRLVALQVTDDLKTGWPANPGPKDGPLGAEGFIPLPLLHASIGLPLNFEAMGRFFTYPIGTEGEEEQGNITLIGVGLKYGLLQSPALPKVAIVGAYHYLNVPKEFDFADISTASADLVVSKGLPLITFYGGLGLDYTRLKIDFELPPPVGRISKEYTKTNFRGTVGLKLTLIPFTYLNADYNFGELTGFDVGLGISFR